MFKRVEWLFFDVGSTLVNESRANEHRILDAIEGTDISYEQVYTQTEEEIPDCSVNDLRELLQAYRSGLIKENS